MSDVTSSNKIEFSGADIMEKVTLAAELYYVYHLHQKDVAARLGVSRPWVSKLLKRAEESGIVKIDVATSSAGIAEVEQKLIDKFHLKNAKVIRSADRSQTLTQCARAAAHYLISVLRPNDYIGIAWGSTLAAMFSQNFPVNFPDVTVIPLVGGIGTDADILSNRLAANLATALSGQYRLLHTPALVVGKRERELIMNDPSTRDIIARTENVDIAIVAMGSLKHSKVLRDGEYITKNELRELEDMGVVGDLALHFLNTEGELVQHITHEKLIAGDIRKTRKNAREMIGFAMGEQKVPIIHAALVGQWVNVLITDLDTANALLAY